MPDDLVEARLIVDRMEALGVDHPALIVGTGVYARELAAEVAAEARERGIEPGQTEDLRDDPDTVLERRARPCRPARRTPSRTASCWPSP